MGSLPGAEAIGQVRSSDLFRNRLPDLFPGIDFEYVPAEDLVL